MAVPTEKASELVKQVAVMVKGYEPMVTMGCDQPTCGAMGNEDSLFLCAACA